MAINFSAELNEEQLKVVTEGSGACLVLAGAGSGKTRTITYRVAYLLEQGVPPQHILLLTFTNKAAREMLTRVTVLLGSAPQGLWSGTFHNIGYRMVSLYGERLGFKGRPTILDSEDARTLLSQVMKDEGVDMKSKKTPSANVLAEIYSYSRNAMINVEEALDIKAPRFFSAVADITHWFVQYEKRKRENNFVDFDDLLLLWLKLLTDHPDIHARLAEQFKYILVDEYQDTNRVQARIIERLAATHHNILAVGDDAQSIYSFRAADIANILEFEKRYPNARVFHLLTNYRSSPQIVDLANQVIKQNKLQFQKELHSVLAGQDKPRVLRCDTPDTQAARIADALEKHRRAGGKHADNAILFRSSFHSQPIEFELTRRGIPYDYRGGQRFFERAHVKDVLCYLRACLSPRDSVAWQRILVHHEGIGLEGARKIYEQIAVGTAVVPEKRTQRGWDTVEKTMTALKTGIAAQSNIGDLVRDVVTHAYRAYARAEFQNADDRLADIEQLANFTSRQTDLKSFLSEAALQEQYRARTETDDRVVLTTIHQAKGLEWDTVFVVSLNNGSFPNERATLEEGGIEEERRLFYVALTRARKKLCLTYTVLGGRNNELIVSPSPFLDEIDQALLYNEHDSATGEPTYEPFDGERPRVRAKSFLSAVEDL